MTEPSDAHHAAVRPASRWVRRAAWATPLCVLPSAVWRIAAIGHVPDGCPDGSGTHLYVIGLSVVSFTAAFLTVGMVSPWGERVPTWVPRLGGREVSPRFVTGAAGAGILVLATVHAYAVLNPVFNWREPNDDVPGCPPPNETDGAWLAYACYTPLLAWLPLLTFVTIDHWRRHRDAGGRAEGCEPAGVSDRAAG